MRAATYIAQHSGQGPVLARDIAAGAGIPFEYLQKLLTELVRNKILTSTRGIGGGFQLARSARQIRFLDVLAPFDNVLDRAQCPFGNPDCGKSRPCPVHDPWAHVLETYRSFLESTTLADVVIDED